jgi:hypothetical protein
MISPVNYRVGLFIRVPEGIGSAHRPVNRRTNGAESRASGSTSCRKVTAALIPEELLSISVPMIGADNRAVERGGLLTGAEMPIRPGDPDGWPTL